MAIDVFLSIDGIRGDSTDAQFPNAIVIASFNLGESEAPGGKVAFREISVRMTSSQASPELFLACAEGSHIKRAVLDLRRAGQQVSYLTFTLDDVVIGSFSVAGASADDNTVEDISLTFGRIHFTYVKFNLDGSIGGTFVAGWDVRANAKL